MNHPHAGMKAALGPARTQHRFALVAVGALALAFGCSPRNGREPPSGADVERAHNGLIAFVRSAGRYTDVYTTTPDGTRIERVTRWPGFKNSPTWSPAGGLPSPRAGPARTGFT
jgi:hypothetical protein